jgi:hypothetical protein
MEIDAISINRAPVLTLWAAIVAEQLGFTHDEALTLGRAVAGLNAYSKGKALGIFKPTPKEVQAKRAANCFHLPASIRAMPRRATAGSNSPSEIFESAGSRSISASMTCSAS